MFARSFMPPQFRKTKNPKAQQMKTPTTEIDKASTTEPQCSPSQQEAAPLKQAAAPLIWQGTFK